MEKEQNNKVVDKEINSHSVAKVGSKWNIKSFTTQQIGGLSTLPLLEFQSINLLIFLVVAQVIALVVVHQLL